MKPISVKQFQSQQMDEAKSVSSTNDHIVVVLERGTRLFLAQLLTSESRNLWRTHKLPRFFEKCHANSKQDSRKTGFELVNRQTIDTTMAEGCSIADIISKKRDGHELSTLEKCLTHGKALRASLSAWNISVSRKMLQWNISRTKTNKAAANRN